MSTLRPNLRNEIACFPHKHLKSPSAHPGVCGERNDPLERPRGDDDDEGQGGRRACAGKDVVLRVETVVVVAAAEVAVEVVEEAVGYSGMAL